MIKHFLIIGFLCLALIGIGFSIGINGKTETYLNHFTCREEHVDLVAPF